MKKTARYLKLSIAMFSLLLFNVNFSKAATTDATLLFNPSSGATTIGGANISLVARVNPGSNTVQGVNAVQLDITFIPSVVNLVSITAASPFSVMGSPDITAANASGTLSVPLFIGAGQVTTLSDVATLVFSPVGTGTNTPISFASTADAAVNDGNGTYVVLNRTGATITVDSGVDTTPPVISQVTPVSSPTNDTTPAYTFTTNEAGTVAYGGDCSGTAGGVVSAGNTTVSFATLGAGTHSNCTVTVTDASANPSNVLTVNAFTIDLTAPVISEITAVTTPTTDNTPAYTFTTNEAGTIVYGGSCAAGTTSATSGSNTISFGALADGTYSGCTIAVRDSATNLSNVLSLASFTVHANPPVLSAGLPTSTLAVGTTQQTISFNTDESAICSWAAASGTAFGSMTNIITSTPATSHSFAVTGLVNGGSYGYFIRCQDALSNVNSSDYLISFSVASPAVVKKSSSHHDDKKSTPSRYVSNSKKTIVRGAVLTQRGKKFSKNTIIALYFAKPGGGYYAPQRIKTSSAGAFAVTYRVTKPQGKYGWYAVDTKTGKKSKVVYYTVK